MNNHTSLLAAGLGSLAFALSVLPALALPLGARIDAEASARAGARGQASTTIEARVEARQEAKAERMDNRSEKAKERADKEIDRRITLLTKLDERVEGMKRVSAEGKASIDATVAAQVAFLTELRGTIAAETDMQALKEEMKSITQSYRIFMLVIPQGHIKVAADKIHTAADTLTALSVKLTARITAAQQAGKDVAALLSAHADMDAKIADAKVQADAAVALVANLSPDNGDKAKMDANKQALKDARAKIQAGLKALQAARADGKQIVNGIKAFHLDTSATTSVEVR